MENYVVRIYRRDSDDPQMIAAMVEVVGLNAKKPFVNLKELKEILNSTDKSQVAAKKSKERLRLAAIGFHR